jgi:hypothetical protein
VRLMVRGWRQAPDAALDFARQRILPPQNFSSSITTFAQPAVTHCGNFLLT